MTQYDADATNFQLAEARAKEALAHGAVYTFVHPTDLLHLIQAYKLIDWDTRTLLLNSSDSADTNDSNDSEENDV